MCCCGCRQIIEVEPDTCNLENLIGSIIHCNGSEYVVFVNIEGDMAYKSYYYVYEYTTDDGVTWLPFPNAGNTYFQFLEAVEFGEGEFYPVRITVRCEIGGAEYRVYFTDDINASNTFALFLRVRVNGGPFEELIDSSVGTNFFCATDTLEFVQSNIDYTISVSGPDSWITNYHSFAPGTLTGGSYSIALTNVGEPELSVCPPGGTTYLLELLPEPTITGTTDLCYGETTTLEADHGEGYDSFLWSTGEVSSSIVVSVAGTYTCIVTHPDRAGCSQTASIDVTIADPLPTLAVTSWTNTNCVAYDPTTLTFGPCVNGTTFDVFVTPGFASYDFGFGAGPDNFFPTINGPTVLTITAYSDDGCATNTIVVTASFVDGDVTPTITQTGDSPCEFEIDFSGTITSPFLLASTDTVHVYESVSGAPTYGPYDYTGADVFTHSIINVGADGIFIIDDGFLDVNGCPHQTFGATATCA